MHEGPGLATPIIPLKPLKKNALRINVMFNKDRRFHDTKGIQAKYRAARHWRFANIQFDPFEVIADANTEIGHTGRSKSIWTCYSFWNLSPGANTMNLKEIGMYTLRCSLGVLTNQCYIYNNTNCTHNTSAHFRRLKLNYTTNLQAGVEYLPYCSMAVQADKGS